MLSCSGLVVCLHTFCIWLVNLCEVMSSILLFVWRPEAGVRKTNIEKPGFFSDTSRHTPTINHQTSIQKLKLKKPGNIKIRVRTGQYPCSQNLRRSYRDKWYSLTLEIHEWNLFKIWPTSISSIEKGHALSAPNWRGGPWLIKVFEWLKTHETVMK